MSRTRITTASEIVSTSHFMSQFSIDQSATSGLVLGHTGGINTVGSTIYTIPAGTVTLSDDETNWVYVAQDGVFAGISPAIPGVLYKVVVASGAITSITDARGAIPTNKTAFTP